MHHSTLSWTDAGMAAGEPIHEGDICPVCGLAILPFEPDAEACTCERYALSITMTLELGGEKEGVPKTGTTP